MQEPKQEFQHLTYLHPQLQHYPQYQLSQQHR
jgi:hypothetical protein